MRKKYSPDSRDYSKYDAMTTQELERILDHYFLFPDEIKDKDLMVHIMEVLTERDREVIDANISNSNASWVDFLKAHPNIARADQNSSEQGKILEVSAWKKVSSRRLLHRIAGIAAVFLCILIGGTITAYAAGIDLFQVFAYWTDDTFCLRPAVVENIEEQLSEQLQPLYHELKSFDSMPLIPTYLPDNYTLKSIDSFRDSAGVEVFCQFVGENGSLTIDYILNGSEEAIPQFEKDIGDPETIDINGICIYIFSNEKKYIAVWVDRKIEASIIANSKGELIRIIESLK